MVYTDEDFWNGSGIIVDPSITFEIEISNYDCEITQDIYTVVMICS